MDTYFEQNVAGERGPRQRLAYAGCWAGIALLAVAAFFAAANLLNPTTARVQVNWVNLAVAVVCAALAVLLFRVKDLSFCEYDYDLWNGELEVCAVYNRSRRKKLATIPLEKLVAWGPAGAMEGHAHGARRRSFCVHSDAAWCLVYAGASGKEAALLELNGEMREHIRAASRASRMAEVKP